MRSPKHSTGAARQQGAAMETFAQMWESFRDKVIPPTAPQIQVDEMRRAFYAGAWVTLTAVQRIGENDITEDAGIVYLEALKKEGEEFYQRVLSGRA